jgi:hypothetical protein
MVCLQHVDISSNLIGCTGWNAVGEVLASCKNLSELDISGNFVQHTDAVHGGAQAGKPQSPPSSSVQGERFARVQRRRAIDGTAPTLIRLATILPL